MRRCRGVNGADKSTSIYKVCMILGFACMLLLVFVAVAVASESGNIEAAAGIQQYPAFSKEKNKATTTTARKLLALSGKGSDGGDEEGNSNRNRIGEGRCSKDSIFVNQGQTPPLWNGIPTYTVQVQNLCDDHDESAAGISCSISDIHLSCGWFSSARLINPRIFRRIEYNDCLVNDGQALNPGQSLIFQYANTFPYPLSVSSLTCY